MIFLDMTPKAQATKNKQVRGFPGGSVVKNPSANAGDMGGILMWGIPHAMEQLNPCATSTEPVP